MKKFLITILVITILSCETFAVESNTSKNFDSNMNLTQYQILIKNHRDTIYKLLGEKYPIFLNCIENIDAMDINYCCTRFRPDNNILIVGSSGAVHIGCTMGNELDTYHTDVLGIGGTTDEFMLEWLPHINKHYDKIIIVNCINSINVCCEYDYSLLGGELVQKIKNICDTYKSLLNPDGKIAYLKPLPYKENLTDYEKKYNSFVGKLVPDLEKAGIPLVEIDYQLGENGLHSGNKNLFRKIITCLDNGPSELNQPKEMLSKNESLSAKLTNEVVDSAKMQYTHNKDKLFNAIERKIDSGNIYDPWQTHFGLENKNLIIGCSPVTFMNLHGKESVKKYGYDLIGFGGVYDREIITWFNVLDKKYDRIVIWGVVNDVFEAINGGRTLQNEYFSTLDSIFDEARKHLKNSDNSSIIFVNVKHLSDIYDVPLSTYCYLFNTEANKVNYYVSKKGIKCVDVYYPTEKTYSDWYVHYTNPVVFSHLLNNIEEIDPR